MKINFDEIEQVQDFTPIPAGKYRCRLTGIEEAATNHGDEMWRLTFVVIDGPHAGRRLFDNLPFSENGMKRVKLVLGRLGVNTTGEMDVQPSLILNKIAILTAEIEEYTDAENNSKRRNKIPFAGYEKDEQQAVGEDKSAF